MKFIEYKAVNSDESGDSVYADTITHCKNWKQYIEAGDKVTSSHECTHGINSDIRNANTNLGKINAFYCLKDRAVILKEPSCRKSDAAQFIPQPLRFSRFGTYVTGQSAWDNEPYYLFDEGVAYANGADCAIYMHNHGDDKNKGTDFMFGPVEFIAYLAAVLMAAEKANSLQADAIEFANWHFKRVADLYYKGKDAMPWNEMEKCVEILKTGSEAQALRDFMKNKIGFTFPNGPTPTPDNPDPDDFHIG
jgi:hypothetical protein